jgi:hypothetical protein
MLQFFATSDESRLHLGASIVAGWNFVSMPIEYITVAAVYESNQSVLGNKRAPAPTRESHLTELVAGWTKYANHEVFWASFRCAHCGLVTARPFSLKTLPFFSYCMIYMTVLDNGTLMTAYLKVGRKCCCRLLSG